MTNGHTVRIVCLMTDALTALRTATTAYVAGLSTLGAWKAAAAAYRAANHSHRQGAPYLFHVTHVQAQQDVPMEVNQIQHVIYGKSDSSSKVAALGDRGNASRGLNGCSRSADLGLQKMPISNGCWIESNEIEGEHMADGTGRGLRKARIELEDCEMPIDQWLSYCASFAHDPNTWDHTDTCPACHCAGGCDDRCPGIECGSCGGDPHRCGCTSEVRR